MKIKDKKKQASSQCLVPQLRFPEFLDAGDWEAKRLGSIGKFTGGGTPSKKNDSYWCGSLPWVSSSDISEDSIHQFIISRFITKEAIQKSATKKVPANSILLVSRVGVGKLAITINPICTSQDFTNFTPCKGNVMFLAYYLKSRKEDLLAFNQGMAIKGFTKNDIEALNIWLPRREKEQQKIADCLSSLDDLIAAHTHKLDTLKSHKKGLMQQLFPVPGQTTPTLRFPDFRGPWKTKPISSLTPINKKYGIVDGPFGSNLKSIHYRSEGIPIIASGFVTDGVFNPKECLYVDEDKFNQEKRSSVSSGDIVMAKIGARCGASAIMPKGHSTGILSGNALKITVDSLRYSTEFVWQRLWSLYDSGQLHSLRAEGAQPAISIANLKKYLIEIPERNEQEMIANCLSSLDELIAAQARKLDTLKVHKKGLMQQLFPNPDEANG